MALDDAIIMRWRPPAGLRDEELWPFDVVKGRLLEAARVIERTTKRVAPRGHASSMPSYLVEWTDLLAQVESEEIGKGRNFVRIQTTRDEMTRAEEAMMWPWRYLAPYDGPRECLTRYLACRAKRGSFDAACRAWSEAGVRSRRTAYRECDRGITLIAMALTDARIPIRLAGHLGEDTSGSARRKSSAY